VLIVGIHEIRAGSMTPGTLMGFFFVLGRAFYGPITAFASLNVQIQAALACLDRILEVLDAKPDVVDCPDPTPLKTVRGHLSFSHVGFSYEPGKQVLSDFSLDVDPGEAVALFGPSGAGKTTVINLLCRFYDPDEGGIHLDGVDLKNIALDELRSRIAYVDQDTFLFNASAEENLLFARPDATKEDIESACKAAHIHDVIQALPNGYGTVLGEQGARLSGGEKQRLSIARAILRDAPIIIFDEATSSLDSRSEALVQRALARLLSGKTSITIAHRIGTIRAADKIVMLDGGEIVASGSYRALLTKCKPFQDLHAQQFGEHAS
jgi:ATP-binding cassette subfamily B protein